MGFLDSLVWILWSSPKAPLQTGFQRATAEPREPYSGRPEPARSPTLHHVLFTNLSPSLSRMLDFVDTDWKGPWRVASCWSQMSTEAIARLASSTPLQYSLDSGTCFAPCSFRFRTGRAPPPPLSPSLSLGSWKPQDAWLSPMPSQSCLDLWESPLTSLPSRTLNVFLVSRTTDTLDPIRVSALRALKRTPVFRICFEFCGRM